MKFFVSFKKERLITKWNFLAEDSITLSRKAFHFLSLMKFISELTAKPSNPPRMPYASQYSFSHYEVEDRNPQADNRRMDQWNARLLFNSTLNVRQGICGCCPSRVNEMAEGWRRRRRRTLIPSIYQYSIHCICTFIVVKLNLVN